jgi:phosphoribosylanthranilate isomerase
MEYIKICGLKRYQDVQICEKHGGNPVGFVYNVPSSPRNLEKSEINTLVKKIDHKILSVAVSKLNTISELSKFMKDVNTDYYQIHGRFAQKELMGLPATIKEKIIIALKVDSSNIQEIIQTIQTLKGQFFAFLIDNSEGKGTALNIRFVKDLLSKSGTNRIILAGGINIENVKEIIDLNPYGIDVSSSLESKKGVKDPSKIIQFLKKVNKIKKSGSEE